MERPGTLKLIDFEPMRPAGSVPAEIEAVRCETVAIGQLMALGQSKRVARLNLGNACHCIRSHVVMIQLSMVRGAGERGPCGAN